MLKKIFDVFAIALLTAIVVAITYITCKFSYYAVWHLAVLGGSIGSPLLWWGRLGATTALCISLLVWQHIYRTINRHRKALMALSVGLIFLLALPMAAFAGPQGSFASRSAEQVIAGYNSSILDQVGADHVCTGSYDDAIINAAISSLIKQSAPYSDGEVLFLAGTELLGNPILIQNTGITLAGVNTQSSILENMSGTNHDEIQYEDIGSQINFLQIENLTLNGYNAGNITGSGVHVLGPSGTVNTTGTTVTWVSGSYFSTSWPTGTSIEINGVFYSIASVQSTTSLTLATSAGSQSGVTEFVGTPNDVLIDNVFSIYQPNYGFEFDYGWGAKLTNSLAEYNGWTGTVTTSGTAVTWNNTPFNLSSAPFNTAWAAGTPIMINNVAYTIASVTNSTHLTLNTSAGTQSTAVPYQVGTTNASGVYFGTYGNGQDDVTGCFFAYNAGAGLTIDNTYISASNCQSNYNNVGINVTNASNPTSWYYDNLNNIDVLNNYNDGIDIQAYDVNLTNVTSSRSQTGNGCLITAGQFVKINNCTFESNYKNGCYVSAGVNNLISNSLSEKNNLGNNNYSDFKEQGSYTQYVNDLADGGGTYPSRGFMISVACTAPMLTNCRAANNATGFGYYVGSGVSNVSFIGCTVSASGQVSDSGTGTVYSPGSSIPVT